MEVFALKLSTLKQKGMIAIKIENKPILVAMTENGVFAIRDKCPHMGSPLSTGMYKDGVITCKYHGLSLSVGSGEVTDHMKANFLRLDEYSRSVRTYKIIVRDDSVYLDL